jgi:MFS family permease
LAVAYSGSLLSFALLPKGSTGVMVFSVVQNFAFAGVFAILRIATMELFPDAFRATASAWTDLFTVLFSAVTSRILSSVLALEGVSLSAVIVGVALVIPLTIPFYQLLPETRGRRLEEI